VQLRQANALLAQFAEFCRKPFDLLHVRVIRISKETIAPKMWHVRLVLKEYPCGIVVQTTREDLNQAAAQTVREVTEGR
jgi:hypothetical protein